jgi:hypothetical protein
LARPRTPTEVLDLRGAFKINPQRKREVGPKALAGLGAPPAHLNDAARACWVEAVGNAPAGVLTAGDRILVEIVARLLAKFREDWLTGAEFGQLGQALGKLGWTPADRSRVSAVKEEPKADPFAEFLKN